MSEIESFYAETAIGQFKATIDYLDEDGYCVRIFSPDGNILLTEQHKGKTIHFLENYVQNRLSQIGTLNG